MTTVVPLNDKLNEGDELSAFKAAGYTEESELTHAPHTHTPARTHALTHHAHLPNTQVHGHHMHTQAHPKNTQTFTKLKRQGFSKLTLC